jgi:hypothetical protein
MNIVFIGGTNIYRSTSAFKDSLNTTMIGGYKKGGAFPHVGVWPNQHPDQHGLEFFRSNPNSNRFPELTVIGDRKLPSSSKTTGMASPLILTLNSSDLLTFSPFISKR